MATDIAVPQGEQIAVDVDPAATLAAHARHRRRFASSVASLDDAALATQSRCELWSVADVLRHLCDVDGWMRALWTGGPLPFTSFDPILTPHEFVVAGRSIPDTEVRERFIASSEEMAADVENNVPERWALPSFSPVGFVPWWLSALHVFFDSWIHERDVFFPLGASVPVEPSEVSPVLAYSLAIVGTLITEPVDVTVGGVHVVAGRPPARATPLSPVPDESAGAIIDALLGRADVEDALAGEDPDVVHRLGTLARIFSP